MRRTFAGIGLVAVMIASGGSAESALLDVKFTGHVTSIPSVLAGNGLFDLNSPLTVHVRIDESPASITDNLSHITGRYSILEKRFSVGSYQYVQEEFLDVLRLNQGISNSDSLQLNLFNPDSTEGSLPFNGYDFWTGALSMNDDTGTAYSDLLSFDVADAFDVGLYNRGGLSLQFVDLDGSPAVVFAETVITDISFSRVTDPTQLSAPSTLAAAGFGLLALGALYRRKSSKEVGSPGVVGRTRVAELAS